MVKPPKIRHSKSRKEPVTIDLEPGEVSRIEEPQAADAAAPVDAEPGEPAAQRLPRLSLPTQHPPVRQGPGRRRAACRW